MAVPWCGPCQRYFNPSGLAPDGTCPACGEPVEVGEIAGESGDVPAEEQERAPWHFWAVVVATVVYVGWRIVQLVAGGLS